MNNIVHIHIVLREKKLSLLAGQVHIHNFNKILSLL
jgi:hypothetical protein